MLPKLRKDSAENISYSDCSSLSVWLLPTTFELTNSCICRITSRSSHDPGYHNRRKNSPLIPKHHVDGSYHHEPQSATNNSHHNLLHR